MTTNKVVEKQVQELVRLLDITYEKDIQLISSVVEQAYWLGRVDQMKEVEKQQTFASLPSVMDEIRTSENL